MIRLSPDFDGGFFLWDDPVADLEGGIGLTLVVALVGALIITPMLMTPAAFAPAAACLLLVFVLGMFCGSNGSLFFLGPLALPAAVYALASSSYAMVFSTSGEGQLFTWLATAFYLLIFGAGLFMYLLGEDGEALAVMATLVCGAIIWFCSMGDVTAGDGSTAPAIFYMMRVAALIGLVWMAVNVVQWLVMVAKKKYDWKGLGYALMVDVIGVAPLVICVLVALAVSATSNVLICIAAALMCVAAYAAAVVGVRLASERLGVTKSAGDYSQVTWRLLLPALVCSIFYFGVLGTPNIDAEFADVFFPLISDNPLAHALAGAANGVITVLGGLLQGTVDLAIRLLERIFDFSLPFDIPVPPALALLLGIVIIAFGAASLAPHVEKVVTKLAPTN